MATTLSPVTVQRFSALQGELITLVEQDYTGLTPKLEQIIRAFEFTQIELAVYRDRGYAQGRGVGAARGGSVRAGLCIPGQGGAGLEDHQGVDGSPASGQQTAPTVRL